MKARLILISHGELAVEAKRSAEMIVGHMEGLYAIAMKESNGLEGTRKKLWDVLEEIGPDAQVVIVADIMSGTPCNVAVQAMYERSGVQVLTGLNLPMLLEYFDAGQELAEDMAAALREAGRCAVELVERPETAAGEEGYED